MTIHFIRGEAFNSINEKEHFCHLLFASLPLCVSALKYF
jgi:hypothetical protein